MVVPIRESANITHTSPAIANISDNLTPNSNINMVIDPENNIYDIGKGFKKERDHFLSFSIYKPRSPSISLSECSKDYHICVKRMSDRMDKDELVNSIGSIKIEYAFQGGQKDQVSKVTDNTNNTLQQHVSNKVPVKMAESELSLFIFFLIFIFFSIYFSSFLFLELWG